MPLPIFEKNWQLTFLNQFFQGSNATRDMMLGIKNALKGFSSNPWTVMGSSNSVAAGMDGVDRWTVSTNLVWFGGGVHSWIVLKQSGLLTNFQICIDLFANNFYSGDIYVSPTVGFSGGSTSARPTASDEVEVTVSPSWFSATNNTNCRAHVMQSTDGECTRIFLCQGGLVGGFWQFDKLRRPRAEVSEPFIATCYGTDDIVTSAPSFQNLFITAVSTMRANGISQTGKSGFTTEAFGNQAIGIVLLDPDDLDGSLPLMPIAAACYGSGASGRYGEIFDLWFGSSRVQNGDSYDETGNRAMSTMRDLIVPSNGLMLAVV
jgi:hypothetical protein